MKSLLWSGGLSGFSYVLAQVTTQPIDPALQRLQAWGILFSGATAFVIALTALVRAMVSLKTPVREIDSAAKAAPLIGLALMAAQVFSMAGCQLHNTTPQRRALLAHQAYTSAIETATAAYRANLIDKPTAWRFENARIIAKAGLSALDAAASANAGDDLDTLSAVEKALNVMADILRDINATGSTTRPDYRISPTRPIGAGSPTGPDPRRSGGCLKA